MAQSKKASATKVTAKKAPAQKAPPKSRGGEPVLLSGGNPQIPKGEGDAPVQAYIEATPGWKREVVRRIDELIVETVPDVQKAVKWNSPFYGMGDGWFANIHGFNNYVKVTFFRGTDLDPMPPKASKSPGVRSIDVHEGELDEAQFKKWVKQASKLPGEKL